MTSVFFVVLFSTTARPVYPSNTALTRVEFVLTPGLKECYYNLEDPNVCENVLSRNVSQVECCCTVGKGWGQACQIQRCPSMESGNKEYFVGSFS